MIGTKTANWGYVLQDGLGSTRQLATHEGVIAMSVAYTPWGDVLAYYGNGGIDFGYLGGVYDENTGLIYMGNGRYYDPVTGRMLTRGAGQSNPYKPGAFDPAGVMVAPLAMLGLVLGKKKKRGKWDTFIALLVVCVVVGMSVSACSLPETDSGDGVITATIYVTTPTITATSPGTVAVTATVEPTIAPATLTPTQVKKSITNSDCYDNVVGKDILSPDYGLVSGLNPKYDFVWETYKALFVNKRDENGELYWWWTEVDKSGSRNESFTPLDFLDRVLQFEFYSLSQEKDRKKIPEIAVGNFCFWTTRSDTSEWSQTKDCKGDPPPVEIFNYIGKRQLLDGKKDYTATVDNLGSWLDWSENDRDILEYSLVEFFKSPPTEWLDWRNVKNPDVPDDIPVEWGNNEPGHHESFYNNMLYKARKDVSGGFVIGRRTNEVFLHISNFHAITYCQKIYYDKHDINRGFDHSANCNTSSRWSH